MAGQKMPLMFRRLGKTPAEIGQALADFTRSAQLLSSDSPRMIDLYENKWIGIYKGHVEVTADTLESLTAQISEKGIPAGETLVRHIDREQRTFIL